MDVVEEENIFCHNAGKMYYVYCGFDCYSKVLTDKCQKHNFGSITNSFRMGFNNHQCSFL